MYFIVEITFPHHRDCIHLFLITAEKLIPGFNLQGGSWSPHMSSQPVVTMCEEQHVTCREVYCDSV